MFKGVLPISSEPTTSSRGRFSLGTRLASPVSRWRTRTPVSEFDKKKNWCKTDSLVFTLDVSEASLLSGIMYTVYLRKTICFHVTSHLTS